MRAVVIKHGGLNIADVVEAAAISNNKEVIFFIFLYIQYFEQFLRIEGIWYFCDRNLNFSKLKRKRSMEILKQALDKIKICHE